MMIQLVMPSFGRRVFLVIFYLLSAISADAQKEKKTVETGARFHIKVSGTAKIDSLGLIWNDQPYCNNSLRGLWHEQIKSRLTSGIFDFYLSNIGRKPVYISYLEICEAKREYTYGTREPITALFGQFPAPIESGDDIFVELSADSVDRDNPKYGKYVSYKAVFSGKGAAKYTCLSEMAQRKEIIASASDVYSIMKNSQVNLDALLAILTSYKQKLTPNMYKLLNLDVLCKRAFDMIRFLSWEAEVFDSKSAEKIAEFMKAYQDFIPALNQRIESFPLNQRMASIVYAEFVVERTILEDLIKHQADKTDLNWQYQSIKSAYQGELRDKILVSFFNLSNKRKALDSLSNDAVKIAKSPFWRDILMTSTRMHVGTKAYNFSLSNEKGEKVNLKDFAGKVVFIDFWYTGCVNCSLYYEHHLSKVEHHFKGNPNVVFLSVAIDPGKERWLKSLESGIYSGKDAINLYTNGLGVNHELIKYYGIPGYPFPMLIDQSGKIYSVNRDKLRIKESLQKTIEDCLASGSSKPINLPKS